MNYKNWNFSPNEKFLLKEFKEGDNRGLGTAM
jgi:hypothetical protein